MEAEDVDFDALEGELIAKLRENPWDTWEVRVVTGVEHLPSMTPFSYNFAWVQDPEPWDGAPLTYG